MDKLKLSKSFDLTSQVTYSAVTSATNLCKSTSIKSVKTPISLLHEICTKCGLLPNYEMLLTEGQVHDPIFIYKISIGDQLSSTGKGNSKKKAKHAAAMSVLHEFKKISIGINDPLAQKIDALISSINDANPSDQEDNTSDADSKTEVKKEDDSSENLSELIGSSTNPIGELIELTQKYNFRPPDFEFGEEEGPPHNRQFVCHAKFGEFIETGYGKSKKMSKRQAALKLLTKMKSNKTFFGGNENDTSNLDQPLEYMHIKDKNKKSSSNFYTQIKQSTNPIITKLLNDENYSEQDLNKQMLENLSQEEKFDYKFFKVPKNKAGLHQTLLQLKINPTMVCSGIGITKDEAVEQASFNALSMIKILALPR